MDSNKYVFLDAWASPFKPIIKELETDCVVHSATDGVIIYTQVKGCQCTIATNITLKGRGMWMFFGWRYTEILSHSLEREYRR